MKLFLLSFFVGNIGINVSDHSCKNREGTKNEPAR